MRRVTLTDAARIIELPEQTLKSWRFRKIAGFDTMGEPSPAGVMVELAEVARMALTAAVVRQGRVVDEAGAEADTWLPTLDAVFQGLLVPLGQDVHAIELRTHAGEVIERLVAPGRAAFRDAMDRAADRAACIVAINLSELATRVQTGWLVALVGREAARADLERRIAELPEDKRDRHLAYFDRIADKVAVVDRRTAQVRQPRAPRPRKAQVAPLAYTLEGALLPPPDDNQEMIYTFPGVERAKVKT